MIKHQLFIAVALLAGVAIGYFVKDAPVAAEKPAKTAERAKKPVADKGEEASLKALRHRIAELEKQLAEKPDAENPKESASPETVVTSADDGKGRRTEQRFTSHRDWLENLKKTDPERYTQVTNGMAQWRQRRLDRAQSRIDFLASIDTSKMRPEARKVHEELQDLIARREEIEERLHQEDLQDEARGKIMQEMFETDRRLRELNEAERGNLIEETARNLGFDGAAAKEISRTIQEVIEATDNGFGPNRPRGGHRGRRGGQGGR